MIGYELGRRTGEELLRFVGALGRHRYVASRLHLVHAFAIASANDASISDANAWASGVLGSGAVDLASKDERLYRAASDAELLAVLTAFWGARASEARARLRARLASIDAPAGDGAIPFDEAREDDMFPVLIDAGWELFPLTDLDPARHRGAIQAFDDFEVARFEEESAVPAVITLHELPALGATELLAAFDGDGATRAPFVLWQDGHETYLDYVLRGVLRASKLEREG